MNGAVPGEVLAALGRLNAHARVARYGMRDAIYAYKMAATLAETAAGQVSLRLVLWAGKCNRCVNGRFRHWDWDDNYSVACRDCGGTGKRKLRFSETTLRDGQVWHHPWYTGNGRGQDVARLAIAGLHLLEEGDGWAYADGNGRPIPWHAPGAWAPNLPGHELGRDELVALLNTVEDWIEQLPAADSARRYLCRRAWRGVYGEPSHSYQLDLGKAPGGCFACGSGDLEGFTYGRATPLFHWSLPVCRRHGGGPEKAAHPNDPPPDELLTPDIRRWLARHERVEEVR